MAKSLLNIQNRKKTKAFDIQPLLANCCSDDASSWQLFIKEFHALISGTVFKYVASQNEKEDMIQEVYCELVKDDYRLLKKFTSNDRPAFLVYLKRISANVVQSKNRKIYRRRAKETELDYHAESVADSGQDLEAALLLSEQNLAVHEAIRQIDQKSREILFLRQRGYKHKEISTILKIPLNTSLTRANRAMKELKKSLSGEIILT